MVIYHGRKQKITTNSISCPSSLVIFFGLPRIQVCSKDLGYAPSDLATRVTYHKSTINQGKIHSWHQETTSISDKCSKFFPIFYKLVGGFNPFEKYESKWESSPNRGENKNIWNRHPVKIHQTFYPSPSPNRPNLSQWCRRRRGRRRRIGPYRRLAPSWRRTSSRDLLARMRLKFFLFHPQNGKTSYLNSRNGGKKNNQTNHHRKLDNEYSKTRWVDFGESKYCKYMEGEFMYGLLSRWMICFSLASANFLGAEPILEIPVTFGACHSGLQPFFKSKKKGNCHQDSPTTKGGILSWELTLSPPKGTFKDDLPFPKMGYVSSLKCNTHSPPRNVTCGVTRTDTLGSGIVHGALVQVLHTVLLGGPGFSRSWVDSGSGANPRNLTG